MPASQRKSRMPKLLTSIDLGALALSHRVVMNFFTAKRLMTALIDRGEGRYYDEIGWLESRLIPDNIA